MHELAIAQALVQEAENVARAHGAKRIDRIVTRVGLLSGVEAPLLERAYSVACAGTLAAHAVLEIEPGEIEVRCRSCHALSTGLPNRMVCRSCGDWRVDVLSGEELLLMSVELSGVPDDPIDEAGTPEMPAAPATQRSA